MVQKKASTKLGTQADRLKPDKQLKNRQYQDGRHTGNTDTKKKMKKSKAIRLSDIESLRPSLPLKRNLSLPEKPPPLPPPPPHPPNPDVPENGPLQPKQSVMKTTVGLPRYMKSTTSFDARKEYIQMSPQMAKSHSDNITLQKNLRRAMTGSSSVKKIARTLTRPSNLKIARTLTRPSNLKIARTLTKTPSFKRTSLSAKKYSKVALCPEVNSHKATCSSTLKDSASPAYLMLNPGGTELEGTSFMKVCPYSYCSLNGHVCTPLPSLKCFLSAKRRLLKTHKNKKLEELSPRVNSRDDGREDIHKGVVVSYEKPAIQNEDLDDSIISPLGMTPFIDSYVKDNDTAVEVSGSGIDDEAKFDYSKKREEFDDLMSSIGGIGERIEENHQHEESLSDGSPHSEIDYEEGLDQNIDVILTGMYAKYLLSDEMKEDTDGDYPLFRTHEESTLHYTDNGRDREEEHSVRAELDKADSDTSVVEWEEGQSIVSHFNISSDDTTQFNPNDGNDDSFLKFIFKSIDAANNCYNNSVADEVLHKFNEEDRLELKCGECDSREDGIDQNMDSVFFQSSNGSSEDEETAATCASMEGLKEELTASTDEKHTFRLEEDDITNTGHQPGAHKANCNNIMINDVSFTYHKTNGFKQDDDANAWDDNQTNDQNWEHKGFQTHQIDAVFKKSIMNEAEMEGLEATQDIGDYDVSDASETCPGSNNLTTGRTRSAVFEERININQEPPPNTCKILKRNIRCKRYVREGGEQRNFNPREPNYLPVKPDPEAEKIDLRHQPEEDSRNAEEWMIDYALRQAVTKLDPARSRRVALLVEAFETVSPMSKYAAHLKHTSTLLTRERPLQACI